jgi:hypothetical protein
VSLVQDSPLLYATKPKKKKKKKEAIYESFRRFHDLFWGKKN